MQPIYKDRDGTARFKENKLVSFLLDYCQGKGMGLNEIVRMPWAKEDYEQVMQLIGYSVGGYDELSMISSESKRRASKACEHI